MGYEEMVEAYREVSLIWGTIWTGALLIGVILVRDMVRAWEKGGDNVGKYVMMGFIGVVLIIVGFFGVIDKFIDYNYAELMLMIENSAL